MLLTSGLLWTLSFLVVDSVFFGDYCGYWYGRGLLADENRGGLASIEGVDGR